MEPPDNPEATPPPGIPDPLKIPLLTWRPQELEHPVVPSDLSHLGTVARSAEVIRYSLQRAEFWLSPKGGLREWFRLNLWIAIVLAIPTLLIAPIASYLVAEIVAGTGQLADIARNLAQIPSGLRTGTMAVAVAAIILALKFVLR